LDLRIPRKKQKLYSLLSIFLKHSKFLNPLWIYKHITSKQHLCVQGPLWECRSIWFGASRLPYYCIPPVTIPAVLGVPAVWWHNNNKNNNNNNNIFFSSLSLTFKPPLLPIYQADARLGGFILVLGDIPSSSTSDTPSLHPCRGFAYVCIGLEQPSFRPA